MLYPRKTLGDLKSLVLQSIGGRSDSTAVSLATAALNWSALLVASLFKPTELMAVRSLTLPAGQTQVDLTNLVRWMRLHSVYNHTNSEPMYPVNYRDLKIITTDVGRPRFYAVFGNLMYVDAPPENDNDLLISYHQYPAVLVDDSDTMSFGGYDSAVVSIATGVVFACFEEGESADLFKAVANYFQEPTLMSMKEKELLEGYGARVKEVVKK